MADSAVLLGVTGIVVSGVVGPGVAAWLAHRSRSREFHRQQVAERRNELRILLDEAAGLLASGPTHLRILRAPGAHADDLDRAHDWLAQVFPIGQRLQLWLPVDHPVVTAYETVRERLIAAAEGGTGHVDDALLDQFEDERRRFLDVSRTTLAEPIPETGRAL